MDTNFTNSRGFLFHSFEKMDYWILGNKFLQGGVVGAVSGFITVGLLTGDLPLIPIVTFSVLSAVSNVIRNMIKHRDKQW